MKVKLAYTIVYSDSLESGIESFNTKKAAQMFDRFLKNTNDEVHSTIIYDGDEVCQ